MSICTEVLTRSTLMLPYVIFAFFCCFYLSMSLFFFLFDFMHRRYVVRLPAYIIHIPTGLFMYYICTCIMYMCMYVCRSSKGSNV
ncbi:hypothetical protein F4810DRAFT_693944, partial [Camillea tinctor]